MKVSKSSANEIFLTPSKIHIYNPGPLVPGTDPKMFASGEQGSMIRNPLIATVLYYNRTIDAFGTGFERVFRLCKDIPYQYNSNQFGFTFEFLRDQNAATNDQHLNQHQDQHQGSNPGVNDEIGLDWEKRKKAVIELIRKDPTISRSKLAKGIGGTPRQVERTLDLLKSDRKIVREGPAHGGKWIIID